MDDDSKTQTLVKGALGALGLGALVSLAAIPKLGWWSLWITLAIIVLALLLFGGYYLWHRRRAKRQREQFTSAIEQQTAAAPRAISDPNKRASLDKVRQKFQTGLQEFKSRGKDIYKLPWYVIIGESGSGKTEAIRHSGIDFPPGMQDELQGSGGTVNMDWWFTNRGIILDTAGSMLFSETRAGESPEWGEFLRLLKKSRPHCPINGLFLVLSIESLIKDSADRIAQKASTLAQQLDLIQRTLDVRFPVYLLVTKCDLLTGFREFFDNIDDPLLQHQMFGWSNPDPLDAPFRPDLVEQHLRVITGKIQRRRLALLRDATSAGQFANTQSFYRTATGVATKRRLDDVDAMFALPESIGRLAPRLRRYLETIFIAGEWSSKPVFLRGIYFTSSMREGKALDEAIAFATGLPLDQLPENRSWEKNRAFFLRDLFHEKVFRESGLVTRATNTLKMLRQQQMLIFGSAGAALLLLMIFAGFGYFDLKKNVLNQSAYWKAGANPNDWKQGIWVPGSIVQRSTEGQYRFVYNGTNFINVADKPGTVGYYRLLEGFASKRISVGLIFKPISWFSKVRNLPEAQQALFEGGVLRPLVYETRNKMQVQAPDPQDPASVARHQAALLALMKLHVDKLSRKGFGASNQVQNAERYLQSFLAYLTDSNFQVDTNLPGLLAKTYSGQSGQNPWPCDSLFAYGGEEHLSNNPAINIGLSNLFVANQAMQSRISSEVQSLNNVADKLAKYQEAETNWLARSDGRCGNLNALALAKQAAEDDAERLRKTTIFPSESLTNITLRYDQLAKAARKLSAGAFKLLGAEVPLNSGGIFEEIQAQLSRFNSVAENKVRENFQPRENQMKQLDAYALLPVNGAPAYERRWSLYSNACTLASFPAKAEATAIGNIWTNYAALTNVIGTYQSQIASYRDTWPFAESVTRACNQIADDARRNLKDRFVSDYVEKVTGKRAELTRQSHWSMGTISNAENWLALVARDLDSAPDEQKGKLTALSQQLSSSVNEILQGIGKEIQGLAGFPVLLNSTKSMTSADMAKLRDLVNGLTKELPINPIWQRDGGGVAALLTRCNNYMSVVNALMDDQGNPVKWEIKLVPQQPSYTIRSIYFDLEISCGGVSTWRKTTGTTFESVPINASQGVTLHFLKSRLHPDQGSRTSAFEPDWGFVRMIANLAAERKDGGATWQFPVHLEDGANSGDILFEGKLVPAIALPEKDNWPRQ